MKSSFTALLLATGLGVGLSACSDASLERYSSPAQFKDDGILINNYRSFVLPTLQTNCMACHASGKEMSALPHSDPDGTIAWQAAVDSGIWNFVTPEESRIITQLKTNKHHCWGRCDENAATLVAQMQKFKNAVGDALDDYESNDQSSDYGMTAAVVVPITVDTPKPGTVDQFDGVPTVVSLEALTGIAGARMSYIIYRGSTTPAYANYIITQLAIASPKPIHARDIRVFINGQASISGNTFSSVNFSASSTPVGGTPVSSGIQSAIKVNGPGKDTISFGIGSIGAGLSEPVPTFTAVKAILASSTDSHGCLSCHATNDFLSNANLANETAFKNARHGNEQVIIPGDPDSSPLYIKIKNDTMPIAASNGIKAPGLSLVEKNQIRTYIENLKK